MKINVLLDLDNTCIYSIPMEDIKRNSKWHRRFTYVDMETDFRVFYRPQLTNFLDWLFKNFTVSVWSAGSAEYVKWIVDHIIEAPHRKLCHVLTQNNCMVSQQHYSTHNIKSLPLLWDHYDYEGFGPYNTLIVDDLDDVYTNNPNNAIPIKKFVASSKTVNDDALDGIQASLQQIKEHYDAHVNDEESFTLLTYTDYLISAKVG